MRSTILTDCIFIDYSLLVFANLSCHRRLKCRQILRSMVASILPWSGRRRAPSQLKLWIKISSFLAESNIPYTLFDNHLFASDALSLSVQIPLSTNPPKALSRICNFVVASTFESRRSWTLPAASTHRHLPIDRQ